MDAPSIRPGEVVGGASERADASLIFIGRIRTPFHALPAPGKHGWSHLPHRDR